jgi:hypothetical protein
MPSRTLTVPLNTLPALRQVAALAGLDVEVVGHAGGGDDAVRVKLSGEAKVLDAFDTGKGSPDGGFCTTFQQPQVDLGAALTTAARWLKGKKATGRATSCWPTLPPQEASPAPEAQARAGEDDAPAP